MRKTIWIAVALIGATGGAVHAYDGYGWNHAFPWFGYGNNGPAAYALGNIPAPPYFALHPPVYYSHQITPRSYGRSPFACPCQCQETSRTIVRRVGNPFIELRSTAPSTPATPAAPAAAAKKPAKLAATPRRIVNPYMQQLTGAQSNVAQSLRD